MATRKTVTRLTDVFPSVQAGMDKARELMRSIARRELEANLARGAGPAYVVTVDGRPQAVADSAISSAMKSINISFPKQVVQVAASILEDALRGAIRSKKAVDSGKMAASVQAFVIRRKPTGGVVATPVSGEVEIGLGDVVAVTPQVPYGVFANTAVAKRSGEGFMASAARRVRSRLRISNARRGRQSGVKVYVGRSVAVGKALGLKNDTRGWGVPVLYVRFASIRSGGITGG